MFDLDRDEHKVQSIEFDGYSIELIQDRCSLWHFLKGNRKEMPESLTGSFTNLMSAEACFKNYVRELKSYVPGKKNKAKVDLDG